VPKRLILSLAAAFLLVATSCAHIRPRPCTAQPIPVISIPSERAGLGLRSPLGAVLGALGSPDHQSEGEWFCDRPDGDDARLMINGRSLWLLYPGLSIQLVKPDRDREFRVMRLEVTESRYPLVAGLGVGSSSQLLTAKLGPPKSTSVDGATGHQLVIYALTKCGDYLVFEVMDDTVVGVKADCRCWPSAGAAADRFSGSGRRPDRGASLEGLLPA